MLCLWGYVLCAFALRTASHRTRDKTFRASASRVYKVQIGVLRTGLSTYTACPPAWGSCKSVHE
jgi:hypothetical protein